jgi:hypothetical protein
MNEFMITTLIMLNTVLLTCVALFAIHARKVYYRMVKRLELEKNACMQYRDEAKAEVNKVKNIQSDVTELKNIALSNNILKRSR